MVKIQQSDLYNDRINPLSRYSRGNSISFEFDDNNLSTDIELYSVQTKAQERYKIRNQKV